MRILIVDDDQLTCRKLELLLKQDGHSVTATTDAAKALDVTWAGDAPQLVILDQLMPGVDGVELCRRIRQVPSNIPPYILLLTVRGGQGEVVEGLEAGADDFIVKPFGPAELRARVRVGERVLRLRRRLVERANESEALSGARPRHGDPRWDRRVYEFGPFRLDAGERRLQRGGEALALTAKVFDLLLLLVRNEGRLVGKDEIMNELWPGREVEENNLTVSMSALRKALGGGSGEYIETVPKSGYRFVAEVRRVTPGPRADGPAAPTRRR